MTIHLSPSLYLGSALLLVAILMSSLTRFVVWWRIRALIALTALTFICYGVFQVIRMAPSPDPISDNAVFIATASLYAFLLTLAILGFIRSFRAPKKECSQ